MLIPDKRSCNIRELICKLFLLQIIGIIVYIMYYQYSGTTNVITKSEHSTRITKRKFVDKADNETKIFWYHIIYKENNITTNIYIHRFYLDDRNENLANVRTFITVDSKCDLKAKCRAYFENTSIDIPAQVVDVTIVAFSANKHKYYTYMVSCFFKDKRYWNMRMALKSVSFLFNSTHETEKIPVVLPETRTDDVKDSMCLCLSPQYGKVTDKLYAPYLIQWMELLKILGVSSVIWNNASMISDGIYVDKVLKYYASTNYIKLQQIPIPFKYDKSELFPGHLAPTGDAHASEILRPAITNDCMYRNMYKQWYIVYTDKDEIIIPYKENQTYQNYLNSFFAKQGSHAAKEHLLNLPALSAPSAFFYLSNKRTRPNVTDHFPLLKFTYRQPTEPRHKSPGYSKSFINPRSCNNLWNHRCTITSSDGFVYLPENEILTHHYRYKCNENIDREIRGRGQHCDTEEQRQFEDNVIEKYYKEILSKRTIDVLKKINYP